MHVLQTRNKKLNVTSRLTEQRKSKRDTRLQAFMKKEQRRLSTVDLNGRILASSALHKLNKHSVECCDFIVRTPTEQCWIAARETK